MRFNSKPILRAGLLTALFLALWGFALRGWWDSFAVALAGDAGGDGGLTAWQLLWPYHFLITHDFRGVSSFESLQFYLSGNQFAGLQYGGAYAFSDMMPGWLPVVAGLSVLFDNQVLIVNSVHVASLLLLSLAVTCLARTYGARWWEAVAAGIFGAFTAYTFDMLLHLQMQFGFAVVFAFYFQRRVLAPGGLRPWLIAGWWLPLAWTVLVSPHWFLFGVLGSFLLLLPAWSHRSRIIREASALVWPDRVAVGIVACFVALSLFVGALPYMYFGHVYGFERLKVEAEYGGLRLENFAYAPERLLGRGAAGDGGPHEKNARVHPLAVWFFLLPLMRIAWRRNGRGVWRRAATAAGCAALLFWVATWPARAGPLAVLCADLLLIWILIATGRAIWNRLRAAPATRGPRRPGLPMNRFAPVVLAACVCLLAAFGPRPVFHNVELPYISPYNILYEFVPGFDRIRASSRVIALFWVFFGIVAARGLRMAFVAGARRIDRVCRQRLHSGWNRALLGRGIVGSGMAMIVLYLWLDAIPRDYQPAGRPERFASLHDLVQAQTPAAKGAAFLLVSEDEPEPWEAALLPYSLARPDLRWAGGYTGVRVDPYMWLRSALRQFSSGDSLWERGQVRTLARRAGVGLVFVRSESGWRTWSLNARPATDEPGPAPRECPDELRGRWRLSDPMSVRHALVIGFRPVGDFCLGPYGRYRDRRLRIEWQGPRGVTSQLRVSTPPYYHPAATELLYAAPGPGRRGAYEVILLEGDRVLHRQTVEVR